MKVKATNKYEELKVQDENYKKILPEGFEFEVSEERYKVLTKSNKYGVKFVESAEPKKAKKETEVETAKKEPKVEKAVKKTTKKSK